MRTLHSGGPPDGGRPSACTSTAPPPAAGCAHPPSRRAGRQARRARDSGREQPMAHTTTARPRIFSGIKPTGHLTLGNYLGALRRWVEEDQYRADALFCGVDLHALTVEHDPARVRRLTRQAATLFLASGLDPEHCTLFVQSHVDEHARLSYLMECTAADGEMRRMIQYKEKAARGAGRGGGGGRARVCCVA